MAYELNPDVRGFLRSAFAARGLDEVLRAPGSALIGVHPAAEAALAALDISSVFDLAASHVFGAAAGLVAIGQDPTAAEARLNVVAGDVAAMPPGVPVRELADQPIAILRAIGRQRRPRWRKRSMSQPCGAGAVAVSKTRVMASCTRRSGSFCNGRRPSRSRRARRRSIPRGAPSRIEPTASAGGGDRARTR